MKVTEVSTPLDEAFVVEAIVPPTSTPAKVGDTTFPSMGLQIKVEGQPSELPTARREKISKTSTGPGGVTERMMALLLPMEG